MSRGCSPTCPGALETLPIGVGLRAAVETRLRGNRALSEPCAAELQQDGEAQGSGAVRGGGAVQGGGAVLQLKDTNRQPEVAVKRNAELVDSALLLQSQVRP